MNAAEEILRIDTPENVVFGYEVAGIGSRFLAALVDTVIIAILQLSVFFAAAALVNIPELGSWVTAVLVFLAFLFFWGYYVFFEVAWNGQSPGKRLVHIRVIRQDGTPVTATEVVIRNLIRIVDLLPGTYGVGVIAMFVDGRARRLGDMAAGVLVVHDQAAVTLDSLAQAAATNGRSVGLPAQLLADDPELPAVRQLPLERLAQGDIRLVESFLQRAEGLVDPGPLAQQIRRALYLRMDVPAPWLTDQDAIRWLRGLLQAYTVRQSGADEVGSAGSASAF